MLILTRRANEAIGIARSCIDTHKLAITNDDGKLSATIEELKP